MRAELLIRFKPLTTVTEAVCKIRLVVGANEVKVAQALRVKPMWNTLSSTRSVLIAETLPRGATVLYCLEGDDLIKVIVEAQTVAEMRAQCERIARQLSRKMGSLVSAKAIICFFDGGVDEVVLMGEHIPFMPRLWRRVAEKFVGKFLPAAVAFGLAASYLPGTTIVDATAIGAGAAAFGAVVEALIAVLKRRGRGSEPSIA